MSKKKKNLIRHIYCTKYNYFKTLNTVEHDFKILFYCFVNKDVIMYKWCLSVLLIVYLYARDGAPE